MVWICLDLLGSEIRSEIWHCFWPPLRAPTVGALRCLQKRVFFWPSISALFYVLYCFEVGVQLYPDFIECVTHLLPDATAS